MEPLQINFLTDQSFDGISGLTRYERELKNAIKLNGHATLKEVSVRDSTLPIWINRFLRSTLQVDLNGFLTNYPIRWPEDLNGLVHLPRHSQAGLLRFKKNLKVIVTVHDIIHYLYRHDPHYNVYTNRVHELFDQSAILALRQADAIISVSEYTKKWLIESAHVPIEKIRVIYQGIEHQQFRPLTVSNEFYSRYDLDPSKTYLLHVSTEEPRKNFETLIKAFSITHSQIKNTCLLKVGKPLYPQQRARHLTMVKEYGLLNSIRFIDEVPDTDLPYFYNLAALFVFPSRAEGFGFPVLEAMACGTPVVCSNATALPEVAGDAAVYLSPDDVKGIADAMTSILSNKTLHKELKAAGIRQAAKFTWQHTAEKTIEVYKSILGNL